jgi:hypothetical protein
MGQKLVLKWKEKSIKEKVLTITGGIISIVIIALAIMQLTGIWENAINVFEPLLGVLMIINALNIYKYNKLVAFFNLAVAVFIFIIAFVIFFI